MNDSLKVSVALATYNGERYIRKQLESICRQTVLPDEVVISDDGSNDNTINVIIDFFNSYPNIQYSLISGKAGGVVKNFRRALSSVTGDIIFLCDQDDIWLPNKVEVVCKSFINNPCIKVLNTSFDYIDEEDNAILHRNDRNKANHNLILHYIPEGDLEKIPIELVINKNISPGMTMAVSREIVGLYLGLSGDGNLHDFEINCIGAIKDGLYFLNRKLVLYRIHNHQTVSIDNIKKRKLLDVLKRKLNNASGQVLYMRRIIDELSDVPTNGLHQKYLQKLSKLNALREKVVLQGKFYIWPLEMINFIKCQKNKTLDVRYYLIDLIVGIRSCIRRVHK